MTVMSEVLTIVYYFSLLLIKQVANNMSIVIFFVSYKPASFPAAIPVFVSCFCSGCHTVKQLQVIILPSSEILQVSLLSSCSLEKREGSV